MRIPTGQYFQMCWVVEDIERAARHWIETAGVGPFFLLDNVKVEGFKYRGKPGTVNFGGAIAQGGPIQVELIKQNDDAPSAYRDSFAPGEEGFHHVAAFTNDYDQEVAHYQKQGFPIAHEGLFGDMRFCYVDTRPVFGSMVELVEDRASVRAMFKIISDAAENWDGTDPIRHLP